MKKLNLKAALALLFLSATPSLAMDMEVDFGEHVGTLVPQLQVCLNGLEVEGIPPFQQLQLSITPMMTAFVKKISSLEQQDFPAADHVIATVSYGAAVDAIINAMIPGMMPVELPTAKTLMRRGLARLFAALVEPMEAPAALLLPAELIVVHTVESLTVNLAGLSPSVCAFVEGFDNLAELKALYAPLKLFSRTLSEKITSVLHEAGMFFPLIPIELNIPDVMTGTIFVDSTKLSALFAAFEND